jgi:hypothetical protein
MGCIWKFRNFSAVSSRVMTTKKMSAGNFSLILQRRALSLLEKNLTTIRSNENAVHFRTLKGASFGL